MQQQRPFFFWLLEGTDMPTRQHVRKTFGRERNNADEFIDALLSNIPGHNLSKAMAEGRTRTSTLPSILRMASAAQTTATSCVIPAARLIVGRVVPHTDGVAVLLPIAEMAVLLDVHQARQREHLPRPSRQVVELLSPVPLLVMMADAAQTSTMQHAIQMVPMVAAARELSNHEIYNCTTNS